MNTAALKSYLLDRAKEPSTWRGAVMVATAMGVSISPEKQDAIVTIGLAIAGIIGVLSKDKKGDGNAN